MLPEKTSILAQVFLEVLTNALRAEAKAMFNAAEIQEFKCAGGRRKQGKASESSESSSLLPLRSDAVSCSHLDLRCPDEDGQSRPVISQPREHSITNIPSNRSTALTNISNCAKYMSYDGTRSIDFHPATNGFATQPATADGASFRGMRSGENDVSPGAFGSLSGQAASNQDTASQNSAYNNHLVRHLHPSQTTQPNLRASGAQEVYLAERTKSRASRFDFPSFEKIHDSSFLKSIVQEPSAKQGFGVPIQPSPQATRPTDRSETGTKVIIDYHHQIQAQNQQIMDMLFDSSNRDQQSAAQSGVMQSCFAFPGQNLQDSQPFDYTHFINTGFDSNAALLNSSFNNPDGAYQCRPAFPNPHHQNISRVSAQQPARHPYAVLDNRASRFGYESQNRTGNGACSRLQSPSFRGLGKLDRAQLDLISQSVPGLEYASISGCWNGPLVPPPPQFHPFLPSSSRTLDHDGQQRQQQREREQQEHSHIVHPAPRRSEYALKAAAIRAMSRSPITSPNHIVVSRASMVASDSGFKIDTPLRRSLVVDFIDPERKASAMDMESVPKSDSPKPCESSTRRIISNKNLGAGIRGPARPGRVRNSRPRTKSKEDKTSQPMLGMSNENQTPAATPAGAKSNGAIAQPPETAKQPVRREVITPRKIAPKPGMSPAEIEAINQYNTSKGGGIQVPFGSGMGPRSNYNVGNYVTRRGASKATGPKIVPPMIPFARVTQPCSATAAPGARDGTPSAKSMAAQALDASNERSNKGEFTEASASKSKLFNIINVENTENSMPTGRIFKRKIPDQCAEPALKRQDTRFRDSNDQEKPKNNSTAEPNECFASKSKENQEVLDEELMKDIGELLDIEEARNDAILIEPAMI